MANPFQRTKHAVDDGGDASSSDDATGSAKSVAILNLLAIVCKILRRSMERAQIGLIGSPAGSMHLSHHW